jgi:hypothetical protein
MIITRGTHAAELNPTHHTVTWPELVANLKGRQPHEGPKDGEWYCFSDFAGRQRSYENLVGAHALVLDFDTHEPNWLTLVGYAFHAWTTYQHAPDAPRWRVVLPLSRTANRYEYYATWAAWSAALGGADGAAKDATRLNYLPGACLQPADAQQRSGDGALTGVCDAETPAHGERGAEWTAEPVERYASSLDDEALITYMRKGTSQERASMAFGGRPSKFQALWDGDAAELAALFPPGADDGNHQIFSATKADAALANELVYYTGGNCERALGLMMQAPLCQRERFTEHKATRAITLAMARKPDQFHFLRPTAPVITVSVAEGVTVSEGPQLDLNANGIVQPDDFLAYLPKHEYIHRPTGAMWPSASLDATVGKDTRAMLDITVPVHALAWAPGRPERFQWRDLDATNEKAAHCWVYNRYQPPRVPRRNEDVSLWLNLLRRLYPKDAQHMLMYLADAVQNPGTKCNHALVLGSRVHGIGKDTLLLPLHWAVGAANYRTIKPSELLGTYNPWVATRILQISESRNLGDSDGRVSKYEMYESTKDLCAAPPPTLACVDKYVARIEVANVLRLILTTNHEIDGLYLPPQDRRYYCAWSDAGALPEAESKALYAWYAAGGDEAVAYYLSHLDISSFNRAAEPPRTEWWHLLVDEGNPHDANPVADAVEAAGNPAWVTLELLIARGGTTASSWLANPTNSGTPLSRALSKCGYRKLLNPAEKRGRWKINGKLVRVYALPGVKLTEITGGGCGGSVAGQPSTRHQA